MSTPAATNSSGCPQPPETETAKSPPAAGRTTDTTTRGTFERDPGTVEDGDAEEVMRTAEAIGDGRIQMESQGCAVPRLVHARHIRPTACRVLAQDTSRDRVPGDSFDGGLVERPVPDVRIAPPILPHR